VSGLVFVGCRSNALSNGTTGSVLDDDKDEDELVGIVCIFIQKYPTVR